MRVLLLNDGGHRCLQLLSFPIEVEAFYHPTNRKLIMVHEHELRRVGGDSEYMTVDDLTVGMAYFSPSEYSIFGETPCDVIKATGDKDCLNVEASERRYSVLDKCCNQFGERDEIQAIIDKLSADVAERDERIAELESQRASLIAQVAVM